MSKSHLSLTLFASLALSACTTILDNFPGIYTLEIQQGNIIEQAMVDQLRPGMSKRQVLYIMGSPMLTDYFHQKRWDYVYYDKQSGEDKQQKHISLFFNNDQVVAVQGDFKPNTDAVVKKPKETTIVLPKRDLDRTLWEKISGLFY